MSDAWSLPSRLRGKYPVGPRLPTGEPEFGYREFPPVNFDGSPAKGRPAIQEEAAARIEALEAALKALLPTNLNLSNPNWPDDTVVPCDVTLGELRAVHSALTGASSNPAGGAE